MVPNARQSNSISLALRLTGFVAPIALIACALGTTSCEQNYASPSSSASSSYVPYSSVSTNNGLTLQISSFTATPNAAIYLNAQGGTPPYTYQLMDTGTGTGTINGNVLIVGPTAGDTSNIEVEDAVGDIQTATFYVVSATSASPAPTGTDGLTLSAGALSVYYGGTTTFTATGGSAPYSFTITSGGGTIDNQNNGVVTYIAPSVTTVVTMTVTDANNSTATATLPVSSSGKAYAESSLYAYSNVALTFDMPNNAQLYQPSFILGGAGVNDDFGANVVLVAGSDLTAFAAPPASQALLINNYDPSDPAPYDGVLTIQGDARSVTMGFCFMPGQPTAYLCDGGAPTGTSCTTSSFISVSTSGYTFSSFTSGMPSGTATETLWLQSFNNTQYGYGSVTGTFMQGFHDHSITNCNAYTSYRVSASSSN